MSQELNSLFTEIETALDRIEAGLATRPMPTDAANENFQEEIDRLMAENQALKSEKQNVNDKIDTTVLRLRTLIGG